MQLYLTKENVALHYKTEGKGVPVILIHSAFNDMEILSPIAKNLKKNYQVISIDLRGHGLSDTVFESKVEDYVNDIRGLLKSIYVSNAIILGVELGATVALGFAYKYPNLVKALLLVNPTEYHQTFPESRLYDRHANEIRTMEPKEQDKYLEKYRFSNAKKAKKFLKSHASDISLKTIEETVAIKRSFKGFDVQSILPNIKAPTLIISGEHDGKILSQEGQHISGEIPNATFELFNQSGELPYVEQEDLFMKKMNEFFTTIS